MCIRDRGDIAVLDIISSNFQDRPVYFAVTCRPESMLGLDDHFQLEGLGLKLVPLKNRETEEELFSLGMMGKGKINADKTLELMTQKFKWGGFDKDELFVDRSFGPAIQSQKAGMFRAAKTFFNRGENGKCIQMVDQFFIAFPFKNFRYDIQTLQMLDLYVQAGAYDKAKPHIEMMATETAEYLRFFESIDEETSQDRYGYGREFQFYNIGYRISQNKVMPSAKEKLVQLAAQGGDTELELSLIHI